MANISSQNIFTRRITVRQIHDMIMFGKRNNQPIFFFGGAGLGKSMRVQQSADILFPNTKRNVCDVRLSGKDSSDIEGMPFVVEIKQPDGSIKAKTIYVTPSFWPDDPDWCGIVFLDELPNADAHTQQLAYQIMLDHRIGEFPFPKGAVFVGAGNRPGDNGATNDLLGPLINRMTVCEVDYNAEVWLEDYAIPYNVHPSIIGFIKLNPDKIYTGHLVDSGAQGHEGPCFSSPRQLVKCGCALDDLDVGLLDQDLTEIIIQGTVGSSLVTEITDYHKRTKVLPDPYDVLTGAVKSYMSPPESDLIFLFTQTLMRRLRSDAMDHENVPDDEFVNRISNFLTFMYDNHSGTNKDTLIAVTMNILRPVNQKQPSLVTMNRARGDDILNKLTFSSEELKEIVKLYMENYKELIGAFNTKP